VVLFPYDFRLGIRDAAEHLKAEIETRLGGLTRSARNRRVIVVAHSMGGLVARYWAGPLGGAPDCRALITVGTPHRGAPKALDWLVNGVRAGPISFAAATGVLQEWPSAYELLPRYPAVLPTEPADDLMQGTAAAMYPYALDGVGAEGFTNLAGQAFAMHRDIEEAWGRLAAEGGGPEVTSLFARGHATPGRAVLAGQSLLITKQDAEWLPNAGWGGDGTVPAISAIPIEASDDLRSRRAVTERHMKMASAPVIIDILREYAGESLASVRGDEPGRPWLGLDLDTMVPAGQPVTVDVELLGASAGDATAVWVSVHRSDSEPGRQRVRCVAACGRWQAVLPGLPAGAYEVTVEAVNVPGVDQVRCEEVIGVVAP
jgi:pimeloyl-ACP methyl ester carboxylesterase